MASVVEIANRALQKVGAKSIVSLTENSAAARAINLSYEPVRDMMYEKHIWNFAIQRATLAASATDPVFGRANAFPLPSDFVKLAPPDPEDNPNTRDWQIEGRQIISNEADPIYIRYVAKITDPNTMTPLFREALSAALAFEICEQLTQSNTKKSQLERDLENIINEAMKSNAIQNVPVEAWSDTWLSVRM